MCCSGVNGRVTGRESTTRSLGSVGDVVGSDAPGELVWEWLGSTCIEHLFHTARLLHCPVRIVPSRHVYQSTKSKSAATTDSGGHMVLVFYAWLLIGPHGRLTASWHGTWMRPHVAWLLRDMRLDDCKLPAVAQRQRADYGLCRTRAAGYGLRPASTAARGCCWVGGWVGGATGRARLAWSRQNEQVFAP